MRAAFTALALLAAWASAAPATKHVLHERRSVPENSPWIKKRQVPVGQKLPVRIGLAQTNLDQAHDLLMEISHPESPKYGQHYTAEEVIDLFRPSNDAVEAVHAWLADSGIVSASQSYNKQWMQFDLEVEQLEELLKTEFYEYEHEDAGRTHVGCDEYSVPAHIQPHIDYITPGIKTLGVAKHGEPKVFKREAARQSPFGHGPYIQGPLSPELARVSQSDPLASCGAVITPDCILAMYNIPLGNTSVKHNELGLFEDLAQWYGPTDLKTFLESYATHVPKGTQPKCHGIDGGPCKEPYADGAGAEANLDLSAAYPLIYPQQIIFFATDDEYVQTNYNYLYSGFFNNFWDGIDGSYCKLNAYNESGNANSTVDPAYPDPNGYNHTLQCGAYKPTNVISISYTETEVENGLPVGYLARQCQEILKLGLQGVTVVAASGDTGAGSPNDVFGNYYEAIFVPEFPASCPYTLAVGATQLLPGSDVTKHQEVASKNFPGGSGFSTIWTAPDYQAKALNTYFTKYPPPFPYFETSFQQNISNGGFYNRIGRGYPDVSAVGNNFPLFIYGELEIAGGTSLSAPIVASIIVRINEHRIMAGKKPVGFVNPTLYAHPSIHWDVTVGNNLGYGTPGFNATPGWDPITGLGTPKYDKWLEVFMALP